MIAAFFHDERFVRDASGTYHSSSGALPYRAFARYLRHFDRLIVVGRLGVAGASTGTVASGPGVEWACVDAPDGSVLRHLPLVSRRAREVLAQADCAIARLPGLVGAIACREAQRSGRPFLVEVVGDAFDALWNHGSLRGKVGALPIALLNRHWIRRAPFATFVTARTLQHRYPPGGDAVAVSDVIVEAAGPEVLERRLARIGARAAGAPATLGLVGSYDVNYKGHETALRAVALLKRLGRAVSLRCIGVGNPARWRARAAALGVEERVELGAPVRQGSAVLEWMDTLDLYAIPSLAEGLPRALVEAMSRGLPAVGARCGGIPELLDARSLHRPGDSRGLAQLVAALLDDPAQMRAQAVANARTAATYAASGLDARRDRLVERFTAVARARALRPGAQPALAP